MLSWLRGTLLCYSSPVSLLFFRTAAHWLRGVRTCTVIRAYLAHWAGAFPSPALPLPCGFYLPPFAPIWPTGLAAFLLLLFPCLVAFICHHLRLFGPLGWRLSFSCSSPALWPLLATICAYLAHWAGAFPSRALPLPCGFYLPPFAPIWPIGLAPFLLLLFPALYLPPFAPIWPTGLAPFLLLLFPCLVAFICHHLRLFGPLGWRLSFSCSSPALWLLLATICAFPSPALPLPCGFYLPPFAPIWPTGLAPFLLLLFPYLVAYLPPFAPIWPTGLAPFLLLLFPCLVAFICHHLRLFGPLGWRLSFSLILATICAYLAHWAGAFPFSALCLPCGFYLPPFASTWPTGLVPFLLLHFPALWLLLATMCAYLAHWAGAFPSPALPLFCGFYLPPFAPIWPTGLAPFLLVLLPALWLLLATIWAYLAHWAGAFLFLLFPWLVAFICHHLRLFSPLGWRLSFSCSSPALWLLLATICAYLAHWAGAFPSPALPPPCTCHHLHLLAHWAGAFPSPALPLPCGFYLPPFAPIWPTGLAPFLLLLFPCLVAFTCHHLRLSFSCSSPALWLLLATICAYLAHWAGAFPSPAFPLPCDFYLPPFAPIWPTGLAPFLLLLFPCLVACICHHLHLFGPLGWRLSFSCSSPALWLLLATICAHLAHWAGAFPSPALPLLLATICAYLAHWAGAFPSPALPLPCGFYLPPFGPIWPTGLAAFLLLLFPCLVAFTCHDLRLFGPLSWRLSFSYSSPALWLLLATICTYLAHWAGVLFPCLVAFTCHHLRLFGPLGWRISFSCSSPALWLLLATICAYLAHWAGAFPSPALPLPCGFYLPPFAPIWVTGLAPFLLLFICLVAFTCHHLRLFGPLGWRLSFCPLGWRLSFSCFSPCLLWLLLATIRAYLAHWAGAFPSHAFLPACCGFCLRPFAPMLAPFLLTFFFSPYSLRLLLATTRAYLAHWAGAFPSYAFLPACCRLCLPPFAPMWPTGLAPFLLLLVSLLVVAFACHHSGLFGPLGWRLSFSCFSPCLSWLLLATMCAYLAHWAGAFPSHAFLRACCGFCLPPFAPIWTTGLAPVLLLPSPLLCQAAVPLFALTVCSLVWCACSLLFFPCRSCDFSFFFHVLGLSGRSGGVARLSPLATLPWHAIVPICALEPLYCCVMSHLGQV